MSKIVNYAHIAQMAFNQPLLATAQLADTVTAFLENKISGSVVDQLSKEHNLSAGKVENISLGNPESGENIAVIPVHGILVPRRFSISACEEVMSYELLRTQLTKALNDDGVKEIVLDINSGGGNAQGAFEIAEFIYQNRDKKPIRALVNFNAFSGAYLIAAACTEIIVSDTSGVGSIGVYTKRLDVTKHYESQGVTCHTFFRGARKVDFHPDMALSDEEREHIETNIENTYQKFINAVAKYRNLSVDAVIKTEADCFEGQQGIDLGLADRLASPQDAINQIAQNVVANQSPVQGFSIQAAHMKMQSQL
jgi:signal peptide peptidase SppA